MLLIIVGARKTRVTCSAASTSQARSAAKSPSVTSVAPPSSAGIAKCSRPIPNAGSVKNSTSSVSRGEPSAEFMTFQELASCVRTTPFGNPVVPDV